MAKKTSTKAPKPESKPRFQSFKAFFKNRQTQTVFGLFLTLFSFFLVIAFFSFFFSWQEDQSTLSQFANKAVKSKNLLGKIGTQLSDFFIYRGFGLAGFIIPVLIFLTGVSILFKISFKTIVKNWNWGLLFMLWISIAFGFAPNKILSGVVGFEMNEYLQTFLGSTGLILSLAFLLFSYLVVKFKVTPEKIINQLRSKKKNTVESEDLEDDFQD